MLAQQARTQAVFEAFKSLYERANLIQATTADLVKNTYRQRSDMAERAQSGKIGAANILDTFAPFVGLLGRGDVAQQMQAQSDALGREAIRRYEGDMARELPRIDVPDLSGIPDPAQLLMQLQMAPPSGRPTISLEPRPGEGPQVTPRAKPPAPRYRESN